ncbi:hypothetical protein [Rubinisphaera italica]|uniref:Uncharacterized protein n=1 Tax=Rubinisphaera italica TaxID=2527969 RepID=A0A5C5XEJ2_9PLAN|nr:hypothetical protein [Rubinisphaera italica]TWT60831.1 hypothetical protein Pan54_15580 [Rubinisphaera italica]
MDQFETVISTLMEKENYWVRQSFKVCLTKEEKTQIGKPNMPRPEIDVLGLDFARNELLVMEVKSYLDSPGVRFNRLTEIHDTPTGKYKLFTCVRYREITFSRLRRNLVAAGMINQDTKLILGLAAGKVHGGEEKIRNWMESQGWLFWAPKDIKNKLSDLAKSDYENNVSVITAKILNR